MIDSPVLLGEVCSPVGLLVPFGGTRREGGQVRALIGCGYSKPEVYFYPNKYNSEFKNQILHHYVLLSFMKCMAQPKVHQFFFFF